ncbi:MAG: OmpA family protein [Flavobacteriales bacterium]|nr:OmpA family protein [Flavobacteriales bacterium]
MRHLRRTLGPLALCLLVLTSSAQSTITDKRVEDLLKRADRLERDGNAVFVQTGILYEQALSILPDDPEVNIRMGLCQLNGPYRHKALPYFLKAATVQPDRPHVQFLLGYSHQLNAQWDEAITAFDRHKKQNPYQDPEPLYNTTDKHISECRNGRALMAAPAQVRVQNMGEGINTAQADYGAVVNADASLLFFTSRRPASADAKVNKVTGDYFEDVYMSQRGPSGWHTATRLPAPVNTAGNDASVGLFNDGRTMLIYRDHDGAGDLYESRRTGEHWSEPVALGSNVNTPSHESSAWYSFDRQWLYFVSERPDDNVGGQDIYRSHWNAAISEWGPAENLGPNVNTIYDEEGVVVHPDGRTIYFSSKGHNSMGGYDVFRSQLIDGHWTKAENMGWPINSPDDDLFFVLSADGTNGYMSSYRADGLGEDDLYSVEFLPNPAARPGEPTASAAGAAVPPEETPMSVLIKGYIRSLHYLNGMEATIELVDLNDATLTASFRSDASNGEYMVAVPAGKEYAMYVKADGYLIHSENIRVPNGERGMNMDLNVELMSLEKGKEAIMRNLFFATASAELQPGSLAELAQMKALLEKNSSLRLEISGHTDSDGNDALNQSLSEARANAVRNHLIAQGIAADRLVAIGKGATKPVAPNDTDANKALNRRTEIEVM